MNIAFHTGKTAMIAQAQALNVYGINIANINQMMNCCCLLFRSGLGGSYIQLSVNLLAIS